MLSNHHILFLILFILCSCKQEKKTETSLSTDQSEIFHAVALPEIPVILAKPEERADFLAKHYWDKSNFADTNYVRHEEAIEQAWVDYLDLLNLLHPKSAQKYIREFFDKVNTNPRTFDHFSGLAEKYLYDPNSPMRNEEMYIPVLETIVSSPFLNEIEKLRPQYQLQLALKNRPGEKALDFTYTSSSGAQGKLYQIQTDYTILFINNPGCQACSETVIDLKKIPEINRLLKEKKLTILAIYPDEDITEWKKHEKEIPSAWINSYDKEQTIRNNKLYDLKAIPSLYLLNKDKIVLLKDAPSQAIEAWITQKQRS